MKVIKTLLVICQNCEITKLNENKYAEIQDHGRLALMGMGQAENTLIDCLHALISDLKIGEISPKIIPDQVMYTLTHSGKKGLYS